MHTNVLVTWMGAQAATSVSTQPLSFGQIRTGQLQTQKSGQEKQGPREDLGSHESLQVGDIQNFMLHPAFPLIYLCHWTNCLTTNLYQSLEYCQNVMNCPSDVN